MAERQLARAAVRLRIASTICLRGEAVCNQQAPTKAQRLRTVLHNVISKTSLVS